MEDEILVYLDHPPFPSDDGSYDILKYSTSFYGDDSEVGTIIYLGSDTKYKIKIHFKDFNYAFYASDESTMQGRYVEIARLAEKYKIELREEKGIIFEVENSNFIKKINKGNLNYYEHLGMKLRHFLISTEENIIELLSSSPPEISVARCCYKV